MFVCVCVYVCRRVYVGLCVCVGFVFFVCLWCGCVIWVYFACGAASLALHPKFAVLSYAMRHCVLFVAAEVHESCIMCINRSPQGRLGLGMCV